MSIKQISEAIGLLNSMVEGGESHTCHSLRIVNFGLDALKKLQAALTAAETENTRLTTIIHNRAEDREVADKLSELKKTQCCEDNCPHAGFWKD